MIRVFEQGELTFEVRYGLKPRLVVGGLAFELDAFDAKYLTSLLEGAMEDTGERSFSSSSPEYIYTVGVDNQVVLIGKKDRADYRRIVLTKARLSQELKLVKMVQLRLDQIHDLVQVIKDYFEC